MEQVLESISPFVLEGVDPSGEIRSYRSTELTDDALLVMGVYVYDYSPVCTAQVCDISELEWISFHENVNVVGISGDGPYAHQQFIEDYDIGYPLLCDTAEEVLADLDVLYEEKDGLRKVPRRSIFVIDGDHSIRWEWISEDNWQEWSSTPISELNDALEGLLD